MNSIYSLFVLVAFVLLFSQSSAEVNDATCGAKNNTDCNTCLSVKGCAYCKTTKHCFLLYTFNNVPIRPCKLEDTQAETCIGRCNVF